MTDNLVQDIEQLSGEVAQVLRHERPVAWLGAGMSIPSGYPSWEGLMETLCRSCGRADLLESSAELVDIALECKRTNATAFREALMENVATVRVTARHAYHQLLQLPFSAIVTTNFDISLKRAAQLSDGYDLYPYPHLPIFALGDRHLRPVYYLHGIAETPDGSTPDVDNLVLTREDFVTAYGNNGSALRLVSEVFANCSLVFLGARLSDPYFAEAARIASDQLATLDNYFGDNRMPRPKRICLLGRQDARVVESPETSGEGDRRAREEAAHLLEMGIEAMWYRADNQHSQLEQIIDGVLARLGRDRPLTALSFGQPGRRST